MWVTLFVHAYNLFLFRTNHSISQPTTTNAAAVTFWATSGMPDTRESELCTQCLLTQAGQALVFLIPFVG